MACRRKSRSVFGSAAKFLFISRHFTKAAESVSSYLTRSLLVTFSFRDCTSFTSSAYSVNASPLLRPALQCIFGVSCLVTLQNIPATGQNLSEDLKEAAKERNTVD